MSTTSADATIAEKDAAESAALEKIFKDYSAGPPIETMAQMKTHNHLLGDRAALDAAWETDGYWLFRNILDKGAVARLRGHFVRELERLGVVDPQDEASTGDVLYKTEPVTYTQDQVVSGSSPACCVGLPMDSLITGRTNMTQVLGLYTATGNFNLNTTQPDNNIQVDGSIATISAGGCGAFYDTGGYISTFNNVGGQIQNCIVGANISTENIWFDRRFTAVPGFAPPWFPSTSIQQGGPSPTNVTPTIYRVQWLNTTSM